MKFKLLSVGQKFGYEGEVYVKTSPLIASNVKTGHNKMIPRYATLTLLDDAGENVAQTKTDPVAANKILSEFNTFYAACIETLEKNKILVPQVKDELDQARDIFIRNITQ